MEDIFMKKLLVIVTLLFSVVAVHAQTKQTENASFVTDAQMKNILALHGHMCAGVAIGIRVSNVALREMGLNNSENELVAIVETDKCPVDAVQMMVGTTAGRQNLIYEKTGKNVFTFVRRKDGKGVKITAKAWKPDPLFDALREKKFAGKATKAELEQFEAMMDAKIKMILVAPESELLTIEPISVAVAKVQRQ